MYMRAEGISSIIYIYIYIYIYYSREANPCTLEQGDDSLYIAGGKRDPLYIAAGTQFPVHCSRETMACTWQQGDDSLGLGVKLEL